MEKAIADQRAGKECITQKSRVTTNPFRKRHGERRLGTLENGRRQEIRERIPA